MKLRNLITGEIYSKILECMFNPLRLISNIKRFIRKGDYYLDNADICIVSFPKCGRTWLRVMLGRVLQKHYNYPVDMLLLPSKMLNLPEEIPKIYITHDDCPQWKKSNELETSKLHYREKKVVLLVRDPRDAIVSLYFHKVKRAKLYNIFDKIYQFKRLSLMKPYKGDISEFISEEVGGIDTFLRFYNIWFENCQVPEKFLLMRYEDIFNDGKKELSRILDFIGITSVKNEIIEDAVNYACFENMQKMEKENITGARKLLSPDVSDRDSYKVRRGKMGGFVDYLSKRDIEFMNWKINRDLAPFYGYKCD
jgi:hypothetical protein